MNKFVICTNPGPYEGSGHLTKNITYPVLDEKEGFIFTYDNNGRHTVFSKARFSEINQDDLSNKKIENLRKAVYEIQKLSDREVYKKRTEIIKLINELESLMDEARK